MTYLPSLNLGFLGNDTPFPSCGAGRVGSWLHRGHPDTYLAQSWMPCCHCYRSHGIFTHSVERPTVGPVLPSSSVSLPVFMTSLPPANWLLFPMQRPTTQAFKEEDKSTCPFLLVPPIIPSASWRQPGVTRSTAFAPGSRHYAAFLSLAWDLLLSVHVRCSSCPGQSHSPPASESVLLFMLPQCLYHALCLLVLGLVVLPPGEDFLIFLLYLGH